MQRKRGAAEGARGKRQRDAKNKGTVVRRGMFKVRWREMRGKEFYETHGFWPVSAISRGAYGTVLKMEKPLVGDVAVKFSVSEAKKNIDEEETFLDGVSREVAILTAISRVGDPFFIEHVPKLVDHYILTSGALEEMGTLAEQNLDSMYTGESKDARFRDFREVLARQFKPYEYSGLIKQDYTMYVTETTFVPSEMLFGVALDKVYKYGSESDTEESLVGSEQPSMPDQYFGERQALLWYSQIMHQLSVLHNLNIAHGDIHHGNVILKLHNKQLIAVLIDYGRACYIRDTTDNNDLACVNLPDELFDYPKLTKTSNREWYKDDIDLTNRMFLRNLKELKVNGNVLFTRYPGFASYNEKTGRFSGILYREYLEDIKSARETLAEVQYMLAYGDSDATTTSGGGTTSTDDELTTTEEVSNSDAVVLLISQLKKF